MLGGFKGFQGLTLERIEREEEEREKEEEERRGNKAEALPNHDRNHSLHRVSCSVFLMQQSVSFVFKS